MTKDQLFKKKLRELCDATTLAIEAIDAEMSNPAKVDRKRVAAILNTLDLAHDGARHFGLGESFAKIKRWRQAARAQLHLPPPAGSSAAPLTKTEKP